MQTSAAISTCEPRVQRETELSLDEEASLLRRQVVMALHHSGGGHYGSALSVIDVLLTLYRRELRVAPDVAAQSGPHPDRDRLILSKGHAAIALYAILRRLGYFDTPLESYGSLDSSLEGHPDMLGLPALDFSTGSLGQGLSVGLGMALALRSDRRRAPQVWVIVGDGECQEGQIWEAALLACQCQLDNLHVVVDNNRRQEWGWNATPCDPNPPPLEALPEKWRAFGWRVFTSDGHDFDDLERNLRAAAETRDVPSIVIAQTVKGKGYPLIEADPRRFHCGVLTDAEYETVLAPSTLASRGVGP